MKKKKKRKKKSKGRRFYDSLVAASWDLTKEEEAGSVEMKNVAGSTLLDRKKNDNITGDLNMFSITYQRLNQREKFEQHTKIY